MVVFIAKVLNIASLLCVEYLLILCLYLLESMTDIWNKEKRSEVMSKIRSKNTKPELILRKALFARGFRYRVNDKRLPGRPDIVFPKYKTVIFIHGCFWHGHDKGCIDSHIPKTNSEYWLAKIKKNKERDENNQSQIQSMGWNVLTIWDCEIQRKNNLEILVDKMPISAIPAHSFR